MPSNQIYTYGTNNAQSAFYSVNGKDTYECANSTITRGVCLAPGSLDECFNKYPGIKDIATAMGFYNSTSGGYTLWTGGTGAPSVNLTNTFIPVDVYFEKPSTECERINSTLGSDWLGCLWGTPAAPYSCTCPDLGPNYEAYIKLRLNDASFWNTPVEAPVKRAEFIDALQYGKKLEVTVAGDFKLKVGQVVNVRVDGVSKYPYLQQNPYLNGLYYITGIKHVVTNSGTHESALSLSQIAGDYSGVTGNTANIPYYS